MDFFSVIGIAVVLLMFGSIFAARQHMDSESKDEPEGAGMHSGRLS